VGGGLDYRPATSVILQVNLNVGLYGIGSSPEITGSKSSRAIGQYHLWQRCETIWHHQQLSHKAAAAFREWGTLYIRWLYAASRYR
jgi:hypothetical protein